MSNIKDVVVPEWWKEITIKDMLSIVIDNRWKTPPLSDSWYEIIEINALSKNKPHVNFQNISKYVNNEIYQKWFRWYINKWEYSCLNCMKRMNYSYFKFIEMSYCSEFNSIKN